MEATRQIAVEVWHLSEDDWICFTIFELLARKTFGVTGKLLPLSRLKLCQTAVQESSVFARERTDRCGEASVEEEVHHSPVFGLDGARLLSLLETELDSRLDGVLLGADGRQLIGADVIFEHF